MTIQDLEARRARLPGRGVAAHRGGGALQPENTLSAFRHAAARGVHQIELDLRRCRGGGIVVMHDDTLDRTTNGSGAVADMSLASLRQLNAAASWKGARPPEPIPTLEDVLDTLPQDLWINLQIQAGEPIAAEVGEAVARADRSHQVVVAGGNRACREARAANPQLVVCTLARQVSRAAYVEHAARECAGFVQFHYLRGQLEPVHAERARALGMRVNYCCAPEVSGDELRALFEAGVDFVMLDDPDAGLEAARAVGLDARVDTGIGPR